MAFLVMGSLNYDDNYFLDHIVMPGETIASQTMESACGGKGFNQAVALAKAGAEVYLAGLVGEADGARICQEARENGIKDTFLGKKEGYTGKAIIQIDQAGQNSIVLFGGANRKWTLEYVDKVLEHFQAEDILILQNEINVTAEIITKAWEKGMKIVLNPSPFEEKILNWPLERVSLFLLNEVEGGQMTGERRTGEGFKAFAGKVSECSFCSDLRRERCLVRRKWRNCLLSGEESEGDRHYSCWRYVYRLFSFCQRKRLWSGRKSEKSYSCGRRGSYEKRSR